MWTPVLALLILALGLVLGLRRVDVRLVLSLCGFALFALAGHPVRFVVYFAREMANEKTIVPICSAMGFAWVLKRTGCEQHLIRLLLGAVRRVRGLLIPGGIATGYVVNTTIVSQASTAATVGPVLLPVLTAGQVPLVIGGSALLLGASMGGELFNPGAVEILTLASLTGLPATEIIRRVMPANLLAGGVALLTFWAMALRGPRAAQVEISPDPSPPLSAAAPAQQAAGPAGPINPLKALVPVLPLVVLFLTPHLWHVPAEIAGGGLIAMAMLIGTLAAGLLSPGQRGALPAAFFEGAGYGYTHVISLIVTATVFTEGLKDTGLIEGLARALSHRPLWALLASIVVPGSLAAASGSGIAPAVAVMKVLVPIAGPLGIDPVRLGRLTAVAAHLGRTMSPAAAVVMMCATVSGVPPLVLVRRVAPPLLCGAAALVAAAALGLL